MTFDEALELLDSGKIDLKEKHVLSDQIRKNEAATASIADLAIECADKMDDFVEMIPTICVTLEAVFIAGILLGQQMARSNDKPN